MQQLLNLGHSFLIEALLMLQSWDVQYISDVIHSEAILQVNLLSGQTARLSLSQSSFQ